MLGRHVVLVVIIIVTEAHNAGVAHIHRDILFTVAVANVGLDSFLLVEFGFGVIGLLNQSLIGGLKVFLGLVPLNLEALYHFYDARSALEAQGRVRVYHTFGSSAVANLLQGLICLLNRCMRVFEGLHGHSPLF